jgi:carbon storage regulator
MLVLSRKEKQTILIGEDIEITICRVSGRRVTVGIRAPSTVAVRRGELAHRRHRPPEAGRGPISQLAGPSQPAVCCGPAEELAIS